MESLLDATDDRAVKDIIPPPHRPLSDELLYPNKGMRTNHIKSGLASNAPNWEVLKNHLYREGRVTKEHCKKILRDTLSMLSKALRDMLIL